MKQWERYRLAGPPGYYWGEWGFPDMAIANRFVAEQGPVSYSRAIDPDDSMVYVTVYRQRGD